MNTNDAISTMGVITFGLALLGAVLGVVNTWRSIDKDRVKLKVKPVRSTLISPNGRPIDESCLSIDVTNLSTFPVTISQIGFLRHGTKNVLMIIQPIMIDNGKFPRRLEPRSSFSIYTQPEMGIKKSDRIRCVYAKTSCGVIKKGKSGALKQFIRQGCRFS